MMADFDTLVAYRRKHAAYRVAEAELRERVTAWANNVLRQVVDPDARRRRFKVAVITLAAAIPALVAAYHEE